MSDSRRDSVDFTLPGAVVSPSELPPMGGAGTGLKINTRAGASSTLLADFGSPNTASPKKCFGLMVNHSESAVAKTKARNLQKSSEQSVMIRFAKNVDEHIAHLLPKFKDIDPAITALRKRQIKESDLVTVRGLLDKLAGAKNEAEEKNLLRASYIFIETLNLLAAQKAICPTALQGVHDLRVAMRVLISPDKSKQLSTPFDIAEVDCFELEGNVGLTGSSVLQNELMQSFQASIKPQTEIYVFSNDKGFERNFDNVKEKGEIADAFTYGALPNFASNSVSVGTSPSVGRSPMVSMATGSHSRRAFASGDSTLDATAGESQQTLTVGQVLTHESGMTPSASGTMFINQGPPVPATLPVRMATAVAPPTSFWCGCRKIKIAPEQVYSS